eukprot:10297648-Alexandrium_andersonii.AAC.1
MRTVDHVKAGIAKIGEGALDPAGIADAYDDREHSADASRAVVAQCTYSIKGYNGAKQAEKSFAELQQKRAEAKAKAQAKSSAAAAAAKSRAQPKTLGPDQ